jgi:hypothetical protein
MLMRLTLAPYSLGLNPFVETEIDKSYRSLRLERFFRKLDPVLRDAISLTDMDPL